MILQTGGIKMSRITTLNGKISDTETRTARIDPSTNSLQTVTYAHHEIHSGTHYFYREMHSVAKNATLDHLIVTPNTTKWSHMTIGVANNVSTINITLYEDTTTSADGSLEDSFNRNRNVADNNTTEIYEAPTVTGVGTPIATWTLGAGKNSPGGEARDSEEIVLKQNAKYLFRVVEPNVAATTVNLTFDWYEHTDKD